MAQNFNYYKNLAGKMIEADRGRNKAFQYYQKMARLDWQIPGKAAAIPGIRKVIDTTPYDSIAKARQVMASRPPKITMLPLSAREEDRERANMIERVLKWQLISADRRRPVSVISDVVESALLYHAVALNVMDLDNQIDVVKDEEMKKKLERARKRGKFVINVFNPADVHVRRSSLGVECVLLAQERPAYEVVAEYPQAKNMLKTDIENGLPVLCYNYMDNEVSAVWVEGRGWDAKPIQAPTEHGLPFMYWVAMMGGTTLENMEEHKYRPILYPIFRSDEWETKNIVDTMMTSDVIWKALAPVVAIEGSPDEITYDTGDPNNRAMQVPFGTVKPLPQPGIDPALFQISQEFSARMQTSTLTSLLAPDIPSGTSFAALNLSTQIALGTMKPAKELAEKALAEMFTLMLLWTVYTNKPLVAYDNRKRGTLGEEYRIEPDEVDEDSIYISVELDPDEPTDKLQRANTANLLMNIGYPKSYALEDMGVEDPELAIERHYQERLEELEFQKYEQMVMQELQMQTQNQQAEAQALAQQLEQEGPILGGQGFNPAFGGIPPALAFPEATRESGAGETSMEIT